MLLLGSMADTNPTGKIPENDYQVWAIRHLYNRSTWAGLGKKGPSLAASGGSACSRGSALEPSALYLDPKDVQSKSTCWALFESFGSSSYIL